jgi:lipopolysaccharide/colanic/teichoic acid biosynthesis glycosyltransferase
VVPIVPHNELMSSNITAIGEVTPSPGNRLRAAGIRLFDIGCALTGLLLSSPVFMLALLAVWIDDGRPCFFRQQRVGWKGRSFSILKFRTMRTGRSGPAITAAGDRRVTGAGAFLRRFKLDELPQFINVLQGDMSMVGPRPEVPEFVEQGNRLWDEVLSVRPGITDLATLLYRNEEQLLASAAQPELDYRLTILPAKLALNIEYMRSRTLYRDIRLLMLTAWYSLLPGRFDGHQAETLLRG